MSTPKFPFDIPFLEALGVEFLGMDKGHAQVALTLSAATGPALPRTRSAAVMRIRSRRMRGSSWQRSSFCRS